MTTIRAFLECESGATSIEYACIGSIISIIIVGWATAMGTKLNAKMAPISNNLN